MYTQRYVVDNRVFLLGLDQFYREAVKPHERGELLNCARQVAGALGVLPADVPIEGYYTEDASLTEYFRLVRGLQSVPEDAVARVSALPEFQRLRAVTCAPLYGHPGDDGKLLPTMHDALTQALLDMSPRWTLGGLTAAACAAAKKMDDFSLVGLAARIKDAVVLTALRESVVLYGGAASGAASEPPTYVWAVDQDLTDQARRFVEVFNALFDNPLPEPGPETASRYFNAYRHNHIFGRCVRIGFDNTVSPIQHYHWGICSGPGGHDRVQEFWKPEVWTTARYQAALRQYGRCPEL